MRVMIVQSDPALAEVWQAHLARQGMQVCIAASQVEAIAHLRHDEISVIVLSLELERGSAIAVADFASYRRPDAKIIFVTRKGFFSDGSIFRLAPNAAAFIPARTPPDDLVALVEHHGG